MATEGQDYEQLRDWYLARLRRQALPTPSAVRLTPSRLIKADAEVVKQLISGKLQQSTGTNMVSNSEKAPFAGLSVTAIGWFVCAGLLIPVFFILCVSLASAGDPESATLFRVLLLVAIVLITLACAIIAFGAYKISQDAKLLHSTLNKAVASEVRLPSARIRNELVWLSGAMQDLTHAYSAARERERAIADFASSLICSVDESGVFVAVSPACMWILAFTKEQLIGNMLVQFVTPEDVPKTLRALEKAKAESHTKFENSMRSASGKVIFMEWDLEWSESRRAYYATARDITELKKLENLRQEFTAMITHDMRSPLAAIISNTKLLLAGAFGPLNDETQNRLKSVERTGNRLLTLVNEILDIDRLESGLLELDLREVSIPLVIESARESVEALAEAKGMTIVVKAADEVVVADEVRLINVIINLLGNALKFSPPSSIVTVEAFTNKATNTAEFRVTDQGRGIAKKDIEKMFDRFRQMEVQDATLKGGSGLGLTICKAVVESHNGEVGVDSEYGVGSTFWFRLPLTHPAKPAEQPTAP